MIDNHPPTSDAHHLRTSSIGVRLPISLALVFATDFAEVSPGGIATAVRVLVRHLGDRFRPVLVGVGDPVDFRPVRDILEDREVMRVAVVSRQRHPRWLPLNVLFTLRLLTGRERIYENADLIAAHRMESAIPFVLRKRKPVILTIHGSSGHHQLLKTGLLSSRLVRAIYDLFERYVLKRVDNVVLVSEAGLSYYIGRYPWLREKAFVVPNGVDLDTFSPIDQRRARLQCGLNESGVVVAYCGRLSEEKRLGVLFHAFELIAQADPLATLVIAGDGPERLRLERMATRFGISRVRFLGLLDRTKIPVVLSAADVFVLPSRFEGFPVAVLEALACGVPVVAADVGGIRDILTGALERFIVTDLTPQAIRDRILEAAAARAMIASACMERARHFDAAQVTARLEALYIETITSVPTSRSPVLTPQDKDLDPAIQEARSAGPQ